MTRRPRARPAVSRRSPAREPDVDARIPPYAAKAVAHQKGKREHRQERFYFRAAAHLSKDVSERNVLLLPLAVPKHDFARIDPLDKCAQRGFVHVV
eukprot:6196521-Pleurochrysis_carterae.AAC.3